MEINACMGIIMVIHILELLICGMCSNPKVNKQRKVRDLAVSLDCVGIPLFCKGRIELESLFLCKHSTSVYLAFCSVCVY